MCQEFVMSLELFWGTVDGCVFCNEPNLDKEEIAKLNPLLS